MGFKGRIECGSHQCR